MSDHSVNGLEQQLRAFRAYGDRPSELAALYNLGLTHRDLDQLERAFAYFEQALDLCRALGDRRAEALILHSTGLAHNLARAPGRALRCLEESLSIHRALDNHEEAAVVLADMSSAHFVSGNTAAALANLEQALPTLRAVGNLRYEVASLEMVLRLCVISQDAERALPCLERLLQIHRDGGDRNAESATLAELANVPAALSERALRNARVTGNRVGEAIALNNLGMAHDARGGRTLSLSFLEQALTVCREAEDRVHEGMILASLAHTALAATASADAPAVQSNRPWTRAPQKPAEELRVEDLWEMLGITRELLVEPATMALLTSAAMVAFCDELDPEHAPVEDPRLRALFGATSTAEGSVQGALRDALREGHVAWRGVIEHYQYALAENLVDTLDKRLAPSVNLVGDTLLFDANQHQYDLPTSPGPRIVVDYGPGLVQRFILREHLRACAAGRPFLYIPVTQGFFSNQFALCDLVRIYGTAAVTEWKARRMTVEQGDGMLLATTRMLASPLRGQVDLILCSGLQMAARHELEAGIGNAFPLLRAGGTLLIRSQKRREPPESSTVDDMLAMAYAAGFSSPRLFHSVAGLHGKQNPVLSAVFSKPW